MKKNRIVFLIYNDYLYIKKDNQIDKMPIEKNTIKNGRINSISLKKSQLVLKSIFKIVNDSYIFIYFADYNDYELNNIVNDFKENGIEDIRLVDYQKILNRDYSYIFFNNDYFFIVDKSKEMNNKLSDYLKYTNRKLLTDKYTYNLLSLNMDTSACFIIDSVPNYIFKYIC